MRLRLAAVATALCFFAVVMTRARDAAALEVCINGPSSYGGSIDASAVDAVIALEPRCVRLMFRQDVWSAVDDTTPRGPDNVAILPMYDALVAKYEAAGIEIHMLVHTESMNLDGHAPNSTAGRADFVAGATKIVDHFKRHVRRFELFNEPNNWDASQKPILDADSFAATLGDTYSAVKVAHANDACWNVDLVSGALFAFHRANGEGTSAADYLAQTYDAGIASHGWNGIKQKTGGYPLDGIGWHLYMESTDAQSTAARVDAYVGEVWSAVTAREGAGSTKKLWVSEFGFGTDDSSAQNSEQADGLDRVFDAFAGNGHVAMGMWFTFQDFDALGWGLYRQGAFDAAHARPSRDRFALQAQSKIEGLWAKVAFASPPKSVVAGSTTKLAIVATNLGSEAWKESDRVRLGAGPGCPTTPSPNAIAWRPALGYANGNTDARAELAVSDAVATGESHAFAIEIVAPTAPGKYVVSARMVKEGVAWFGTSAELGLDVVSTPGGGADGGGVDDGGDGGGGGGGGGDGGAGSGNGGAPPSSDAGSSGGCAIGFGAADAGALGAVAVGALLLAITRRRARR